MVARGGEAGKNLSPRWLRSPPTGDRGRRRSSRLDGSDRRNSGGGTAPGCPQSHHAGLILLGDMHHAPSRLWTTEYRAIGEPATDPGQSRSGDCAGSPYAGAVDLTLPTAGFAVATDTVDRRQPWVTVAPARRRQRAPAVC